MITHEPSTTPDGPVQAVTVCSILTPKTLPTEDSELDV